MAPILDYVCPWVAKNLALVVALALDVALAPDIALYAVLALDTALAPALAPI